MNPDVLTTALNSVFRLPSEGIDLEEVEKKLILEALERSNGNRTQAAKLLNISPPTFYYRLKKYGLVQLFGSK